MTILTLSEMTKLALGVLLFLFVGLMAVIPKQFLTMFGLDLKTVFCVYFF